MAAAIRILYVDDEPSFLELSKIFLERSGDFIVTTAISAPEAIRILGQENFDAIVSDYQMPEMDGIEFLKHLKSEGNATPFIIFTGKGREEIAIKAFENGADFYVQKGGEPKAQFAELAHKILRAVQHRSDEKALLESEARFRALVENTSDIIRILDREGRIVFETAAAGRELGYPPGYFLGRHPSEFIHPDDLAVVKQELSEVYTKTNTGVPTEFRIRKADGSYEWAESVGKNLFGVPGVDGVVIATRFIDERKKAEEALRESEKRLREAQEMAHLGFWYWDVKTGNVEWSEEIFKIFCLDPKEFTPNIDSILALSPWPEDHQRDRDLIQKAMESHDVGTYEQRFLRPDKSTGYYYSTFQSRYDDGGNLVFIVGTVMDITERKRAEEELRESEERFRSIFSHAAEGILIADISTQKFLYANPAICNMLGYSAQELTSMGMRDIHPEKDLAHVQEEFMALARGEKTLTESIPVLRKNGDVRYMDIRTTPVIIDGHRCNLGMFADITDRKQTEGALRESEERLKFALEGTNDGIWDVQMDTGAVYLSPRGCEILGYAPKELPLIAQTWSQLVHPDDLPATTTALNAYLEGRVPIFNVEQRLKTKSGNFKWILTRGKAISRDETGAPSRMVGTHTDITERKQAEEALRQSETRYREFFTTSRDCVFISSPGGRWIDFNNVALDLFGYSTRQELADVLIPDLYENADVRKEFNAIIIRDGYAEDYPVHLKKKDGTIIDTLITSVPLKEDDGGVKAFFGTIRDVTKQKRAEQEIRTLQQFQQSIIDNAKVWISVLDPKGTILVWNRAAEEISGYKADEVIGKNIIWKWIYPDKDYRRTITATIKEIIGTNKYLENFETRIQTKDGQERIIWWNTRALQDMPGIDKKFIAIGKEVTELKTLNDALRQANNQLNLLSSITRHDIKNQLLALSGYLEISKESLGDPARTSEFIAKEKKIADTIAHQISFTKDYEELGVAAPEWQNVNVSVKKAISGLPVRDVRIEVDPKNPEIFADRLFEKVFYNLIDNALRYGGPDMKTIRVSSQESDQKLTIICEDDGVGITADDKKRLFTRGFGKNSGLGLFLSREILSITGITITENGTPGKGARFEITVSKGKYRFAD